MAHLIDKDKIVAEIERKMNLCKKILLRSRTPQNEDYHQGNIEAYEVVISLLDTLEVKEVGEEPTSNDLEEATEHSSLTFEAFLDYLDSTNEFGEELRPLAFKVIGRIINKFKIY